MDFEYMWEELELNLSIEEMERLIRYLNLNDLENARALIEPVLEDAEDIDFFIQEYHKISTRKCELIPYTPLQIIEDFKNHEINMYVCNIFGCIENVVFFNLGTQENPQIKFMMKNDLLGMDKITQIWKPVYKNVC